MGKYVTIYAKAENAAQGEKTQEENRTSMKEVEKDKKTAPHSGHRRRLIEKAKREDLSEYEYLELLLFNAIPRRNTSDLSHRLLSRFGSVQNLFSATEAELLSVEGIGESVAMYLFSIGRLCNSYARKMSKGYYGKYEPERFLNYLKNLPEYRAEEVLEILLLDENGYIILRQQFEGGVERVIIHPENLTKLLLDHKPCGVVIAHNHPSGDPTPSAKDEEMTRKCQMLCASHNVILCDHVIYGANGVYSYYDSGELKAISQDYSPDNVIKILQ